MSELFATPKSDIKPGMLVTWGNGEPKAEIVDVTSGSKVIVKMLSTYAMFDAGYVGTISRENLRFLS